MENDTYAITGYGNYEDRCTVLLRYKVYDQEYQTELFLSALTGSETPTANDLTTALDDWLLNKAKPQLEPVNTAPSAALEALIDNSIEV
jgi:hypothetical protein